MIGLICFKWNSTSKWRMTVANRVCGTLLLRHTTIVTFAAHYCSLHGGRL